MANVGKCIAPMCLVSQEPHDFSGNLLGGGVCTCMQDLYQEIEKQRQACEKIIASKDKLVTGELRYTVFILGSFYFTVHRVFG